MKFLRRLLLKLLKAPRVSVAYTTGRAILCINGYIVAVEGDLCRDSDALGQFSESHFSHWNREMFKHIEAGGQSPGTAWKW